MKFLTSLAFLFLLSGCDVQFEEASGGAPTRPESVPESTLWIGGKDGGVFVEISATDQKPIYKGAVYYDSSGDIWYQGEFEYTGQESFETDEPSSYSFWDGTDLYLKNGEKLKAVGLEAD